MTPGPSNLHLAWARLLLRGLRSSGVSRVVLSPGSRSTPLVLAAAAESGLRCDVVLDERTAAFFALGQARASGEPSALICTSGTAAAHYLPAVIEASQSRVPLIVVTADRPWEAYDVAAPQTIDQVKLFGGHVRHYAELGLPDVNPVALRAVVRLAAQAALRARAPVAGPVHINARFRKPLEPVATAGPEGHEAEVAALLERGAPRAFAALQLADERAVAALAAACRRAARGLIVCGPAPLSAPLAQARAAIAALANATGFAVLAEATSQLRFGATTPVQSNFDAWMRDARTRARLEAELVIEIGAPPTSAGYAGYLAERSGAERWVLAHDGWNDPASDASAIVQGDPYDAAHRVARALEPGLAERAEAQAFRQAITRAGEGVDRAVAAEMDGAALTEGRIAHQLVARLPAGSLLVVGNSSPVRDLDLYAPRRASELGVVHQRGASGIDGMLATASGVRAVSAAPAVALLTGDLGLVHDLGALAVARTCDRPLVVLVVQNAGGRIFEQLPIGRSSVPREVFETYFATPQQVDFASAAQAHGVRHVRVATPEALGAALDRALHSPGCTLVEAVVPPHDASDRRAAVYAAAAGGGP